MIDRGYSNYRSRPVLLYDRLCPNTRAKKSFFFSIDFLVESNHLITIERRSLVITHVQRYCSLDRVTGKAHKTSTVENRTFQK